jgi:hypothetical protein
LKLSLASLAVLTSSLAVAAPYGTAGCGLGSVLFGDDPGGIQILAATFNATFANQTFGITTGTLNCGKGALGSGSAKVFIEANREALSKDISRGAGETVDTLTQIAGCSSPAAVGALLQSRFSTLFPSETVSSEEVTESILGTLRAEPALACVHLS